MSTTGMTDEQIERLAQVFERIWGRFGLPRPAVAPKLKPEELTDEDRKAVDEFMEQMDSQINEVAVDLLRAEVHDRILTSRESIEFAKKALREKKEAKLKRKKGCIFLQTGEGTPNDPIDEMLIATT